jgi:hypothetical protein
MTCTRCLNDTPEALLQHDQGKNPAASFSLVMPIHVLAKHWTSDIREHHTSLLSHILCNNPNNTDLKSLILNAILNERHVVSSTDSTLT